MYILIDKKKMCVLYKNDNWKTLSNLSHIEVAHNATAIVGINESDFSFFTDLELKLLYANLCGQKYTGYARKPLIQNIVTLCNLLELTNLNGWEISLQAACIQMDDDNYYKYVPKSNQPLLLDDEYTPKSLTAALNSGPIVTLSFGTKAAPTPVKSPVNTMNPSTAPSKIVVTDWSKK